MSTVSATELGAVAIKGALDKITLDPELVNEVFMGHVVQSGVGQAPARQAAISAGIPKQHPMYNHKQSMCIRNEIYNVGCAVYCI